MNKSHGDGNQNILGRTFPLILGGPWGPTKGPIPIFLNGKCLVAPYNSN
jgi:hypothetical protein